MIIFVLVLRSRTVFLTAAFFLLLLYSEVASAQVSLIKATFLKAKETETDVFVTMVDNNTFMGGVLSVDDESAAVETIDGIFNLNYSRIKTVELVVPEDITTRWYKNIAASKLFITPSGRMQEAGTGYYQNTWLFISTLSYGITKNVTVSGYLSMFPEVAIKDQLFMGTVKAGRDLSRHFSVSLLGGYYTYSDIGTRNGVGILLANATYTWNQLNITGGLGRGFGTDADKRLIYIGGAQFRISEKFALLTENIMLPDGNNDTERMISIGGRFIDRTIAADFGFMTTTELTPKYPFVSFTVKL